MDHCNHVSDWLKTLVDEFDFNMETLSEYLGLSAEQITELKNGNVDQLPRDTQAEQIQMFQCFSKIGYLYCCAADDREQKLGAFLKTLISYHNISKKTIAKMSGVDIKDIEKILRLDKNKVSPEIKFKLAVTVFSLRFFLKDCGEGPLPDNLL